jgi:hypothetical protein
MNTNAIHNFINILLTVIGSLMLFDWGVFGMAAEDVAVIMGGLGFAKLVINAIRDGLTKLFSPQPPVE